MGKLASVYYEVAYRVDSSELKKADGELKKADGSVRNVKKGTDDFGDSLLSIGSKVAGVTAIIGVATGIATGINKATEQFAEFEYQIAKVNAKGDMTSESFKTLKNAAFEAGKNTSFSAKEAAKGLEYMAMAGWSAVDSAKALPAVLDVAVVAGEELALVSDIMTDQMTVFKLGADQAEHFSDVLAYSANKSNTSIGMMGEAMKYAGPPMATLGSTAEETAALFMSMADGGIKASQAGTTLRTAALRLVSPSKEAQKVIKKLGLEVKDGNKNFIGMTSIMAQLEEETKGMTDIQKAQTLEVLFGKEAVSGMMVVLDQGTEKVKKNTEALKNNNGYARKSAEYMKRTLKGQIIETTSKQEALSTAIGETFSPAKLELVKNYNKLLDSMLEKTNNNVDELGKYTNIFVGAIEVAKDVIKIVGETQDYLSEIPFMKLAKFSFGNVIDYATLKPVRDFLNEKGKEKISETELELVLAQSELERVDNPYNFMEPISYNPYEKIESPFKANIIEKYNNKNEMVDSLKNNDERGGGVVFSPTYTFGDFNISVPKDVDINDPKALSKLIPKLVLKELENRDKILLNQMNPKRR